MRTGYADEFWPFRAKAGFGQCVGTGSHHVQTAGGVYVKQAHLGEEASGGNGSSDSVGDVVIFEVEKDFRPQGADLVHGFRPRVGKEVNVDLKHPHQSGKLVGQGESFIEPPEIQRDDESIAGCCVQGRCGSSRSSIRTKPTP